MSLNLSLLTILCVVLISIGQMLFKRAALGVTDAGNWAHWVFNPWLLAALALYGVTTLFWVWILRHAPLHLAYPFMGLAFVLVPLMGALFLNEPVTARTFVGGALILAGIVVVSR